MGPPDGSSRTKQRGKVLTASRYLILEEWLKGEILGPLNGPPGILPSVGCQRDLRFGIRFDELLVAGSDIICSTQGAVSHQLSYAEIFLPQTIEPFQGIERHQ